MFYTQKDKLEIDNRFRGLQMDIYIQSLQEKIGELIKEKLDLQYKINELQGKLDFKKQFLIK